MKVAETELPTLKISSQNKGEALLMAPLMAERPAGVMNSLS